MGAPQRTGENLCNNADWAAGLHHLVIATLYENYVILLLTFAAAFYVGF
jgi:hypothetical protein